jgi:hypothetical protein
LMKNRSLSVILLKSKTKTTQICRKSPKLAKNRQTPLKTKKLKKVMYNYHQKTRSVSS